MHVLLGCAWLVPCHPKLLMHITHIFAVFACLHPEHITLVAGGYPDLDSVAGYVEQFDTLIAGQCLLTQCFMFCVPSLSCSVAQGLHLLSMH